MNSVIIFFKQLPEIDDQTEDVEEHVVNAIDYALPVRNE